jgi:hypothetical protein
MKSKRRHEGYLLVDHRNSPGLTELQAIAAGRPVTSHVGLFEARTYRCNHCQVVVIIETKRTRARGYCSKCNHYICDTCDAIMAATGVCRTVKQIIEEIQEAASAAGEN